MKQTEKEGKGIEEGGCPSNKFTQNPQPPTTIAALTPSHPRNVQPLIFVHLIQREKTIFRKPFEVGQTQLLPQALPEGPRVLLIPTVSPAKEYCLVTCRKSRLPGFPRDAHARSKAEVQYKDKGKPCMRALSISSYVCVSKWF